MKLNKIIGVVVLIAAAALLVMLGVNQAQKSDTGKQTSKITAVASYYPLHDFAKNVGGDKVQVTNITPAGSEPHDYEPTPRQLIEVQKSAVFIYNGGTFEPWVEKFLPDYKNKAVKASDGIDLLKGEEDDHHGEEEGQEPHDDEGDIRDPHFWLDPVLAKSIIDNIEQSFSEVDPANKKTYQRNADDYKAKLDQLDSDYQAGLANCQTRTVISSHDAFSYLAKRYNIEVAAIAGLSPEEEPSAAKLAELTRLARDKNIKYIFFESLASPKLADTLAKEIDAKTAVFDPIEGISEADQNNDKDYIGVQRENLKNLRRALSCQ